MSKIDRQKIDKIKKRAEAVLLKGGRVEVNEDGIPCFIATSGEDAYREGEDPGERQSITAIVKHWAEDKFLILKWKKVAWHTFITGGIEEEQTAEEAARMEILEETGYKNLKLIKLLSRVDAKFYHIPKQTNRTAQFTNFYFELENDERDEIDESEKNKHQILWIKKEKVANLLVASGMGYIWKEVKHLNI
jgi:8-oxo-dGTP pyrophosphatase MutT (NUDIX family)